MRRRTLYFAPALAAFALCGCANEVRSDDPPAAPSTVSCADASQLRQRALDDRRRSAERKSDHEKIYIGNRGNFLASLAIVADLKCKGMGAEVDKALKPAFEAARKAEETRSMYERAIRWSEADFIATQAIALVIEQLAATPTPSDHAATAGTPAKVF